MLRSIIFLEQKNILQDILFGMSKAHIIVPGFYKEEYPSYKIRLKYVENNQYLMGWFQSEDYFKEYEDIIRKDLMPNKKIRISNKLRRLLVEEKRWPYILDERITKKVIIFCRFTII